MRGSRVAVAACLTVLASAARAGPPHPSTGRWVVNFDAAQCLASRNYGTAKNPLFLVLKAPPLGDVMKLAVMRDGPAKEPQQYDATLTFGGSRLLKTSVLAYKLRDGSLITYTTNLAAADFAAFRQAKSLSIRSVGLSENFILSGMAPLLRTMEACVSSLRLVWNVTDPKGSQSKLQRRATANLAVLFSNEDYPAVAIDEGQSGAVEFALLIDEAGKVADCTVIGTSGAASLDSQTCGVLKRRAKFKPAAGADGKPAKDAVIGRIRWKTMF